MRVITVDTIVGMMENAGVDLWSYRVIVGGITGRADSSRVWKHDGMVYEIERQGTVRRAYLHTAQEVNI